MKNLKTVLHDFIEIVSKSKHKQIILWIDHGREFYNKLMQKWLDNDDIFMQSALNKGNTVVAQMFIKKVSG